MTVKTLTTYTNGGGRFEVMGVTINCGPKGDISSLSDWSSETLSTLEAAGVLERKVWHGNGLYGHDTFRFLMVPATK